jgi:hypothetical protein
MGKINEIQLQEHIKPTLNLKIYSTLLRIKNYKFKACRFIICHIWDEQNLKSLRFKYTFQQGYGNSHSHTYNSDNALWFDPVEENSTMFKKIVYTLFFNAPVLLLWMCRKKKFQLN